MTPKELADTWYFVGSAALVGSLMVGVLATGIIWYTSNVKEVFLNKELRSADNKAADANKAAETAKQNAHQLALELEVEKQKRLQLELLLGSESKRIESQLSPRQIQSNSFSRDRLKQFNQTHYAIIYVYTDADSTAMAAELGRILLEAGWVEESSATVRNDLPAGVLVRVGKPDSGPATDRTHRAGAALTDFLLANRVDVQSKRDEEIKYDAVVIDIGAKPPPSFMGKFAPVNRSPEKLKKLEALEAREKRMEALRGEWHFNPDSRDAP